MAFAFRTRLRGALSRGTLGIALLVAGQLICTLVFLLDILSSIIGLRSTPISWQLREMVELGAAMGLLVGLVLGSLALRHAIRQRNEAEARLRRAAGDFQTILAERLDEWGLTPAERDVAMFAIKGLSTAEIAALRATSEGTVKAQTNAIYRKAGVTGRPQLLSLFIEELMQDQGDRPARAQAKSASSGRQEEAA
ncbi:helix-turn-helix transcriptional regulator [Gemmobacter serpentinus]|uniref:helix-turn-helix transcriptional regulator n=1 Tax=Gemmobacter serpentinus TaxID=2652247 RepID=UPI00124E417B|nr:helix-turn-helix transcriptional regulator [Gemmobacter serpentinus]